MLKTNIIKVKNKANKSIGSINNQLQKFSKTISKLLKVINQILTQRQKLNRIILSQKSLKIHLGCGQDYIEGDLNIDSSFDSKADIIRDCNKLDCFPDGCADLIESYHFFEHFQLHEARFALREWYRILKPGGLVIIELPNLEVCAQEIGKHFNKNGSIDMAVAAIYSWPPKVAEYGYPMLHKWGWTPKSLEAELLEAGFTEIQQHPIRQTWRTGGLAWNRDMQIRATKPLIND